MGANTLFPRNAAWFANIEVGALWNATRHRTQTAALFTNNACPIHFRVKLGQPLDGAEVGQRSFFVGAL